MKCQMCNKEMFKAMKSQVGNLANDNSTPLPSVPVWACDCGYFQYLIPHAIEK